MAKKNYTKEFLKRWGNGAIKIVKQRAPVETGSLRADVNYEVKETKKGFNMTIYIDDHIQPAKSDTLPSVYGKILDEKKGLTDKAHGGTTYGWFSSPIKGFSQKEFIKQATIAVKQDLIAKQKENR